MTPTELDATSVEARPPEHAVAPPVAAAREARPPRKFGLRAALTGLVLLTVAVTAVRWTPSVRQPEPLVKV